VHRKKTIQHTGHEGFSDTYSIHLCLNVLDEFFPFSFPQVSERTKPFNQGLQVEQTEKFEVSLKKAASHLLFPFLAEEFLVTFLLTSHSKHKRINKHDIIIN
jgi:hypothetical protein